MQQLHELNFAHTDIKLSNILVDGEGVAFLNDLEYAVPKMAPPRPEGLGAEWAKTAEEQDSFQLNLLAAEIFRL